MKKEANERNSAFDVLRILLALFVIALHFNNSRDGGHLFLQMEFPERLFY